MFGINTNELPQGVEYITPGIHNVKIKEISNLDTSGTPFINIVFTPVSNDAPLNQRLYFTEKSQNISKMILGEILTAILGEEKVNSLSAEDINSYINLVRPMILNKPYFQKFNGEKKLVDGVVKTYAKLPLSRKTQKNPVPTIAAKTAEELSFNEETDVKDSTVNQNEVTANDTPSWGN